MDIEPEYFNGICKVICLTLLISVFPIYYMEIESQLIIFIISIITFFIVLILKNKRWIKRVKIDFKNSEIRIEYPINFYGNKKLNLSFSKINKATYYEYMYRTPAHYKIEYKDGKLRFECNGKESEKINSILEKNGIKTNFYHKKEKVGYR